MTEHLDVTTSDRGLDYLPPIPSRHGGEIRVFESSDATGPHVRLTATAPANPQNVPVDLSMTAENAWRLAEQLMFLVRNHVYGDTRPERRVADLMVDGDAEILSAE